MDLDGPVVEYFAINLRKAREDRGISQAELAQQVKDLGSPCTQATIWKLEQGHREPKLSEAVAIGRALGLWSWTELTSQPAMFDVAQSVDRWRHRAHQLADQTRAAAAAQLEALVQLSFAVRSAQDAGLSERWVDGRSGGWLELTPEMTVLREVLSARAEWSSEDDVRDLVMDESDRLTEQITSALENSGVTLAIRPEDITFVPANPSTPEGETEEQTSPG